MADRTIRVRLLADINNFQQGMKRASTEAASFGRTFAGHTDAARHAQEQFGRGSLIAGGLVAAGIGLMAKAAVDWESAWAGVTKTVDASDAELSRLEDGLREMARTLPATHDEIAGVAEAAGALGVETGAIEGFTRVMIDLGETTNLTSDAAATAFARIANVMGTSQSDFDRMGATIVALGNSGASTEQEIAELANRLAAAGGIAGLSEADVFAFAETLASVGVEAEAGGTALSKVFTAISDAVIDGSDKLDVFAQVAGVSAQEFSIAFREDAAGAIATFIEGLGQMSAAGQSTTGVFSELELTDQRLMRALRSTGEAGDYLRQQIGLASDAWEENTALTDEAAARYDTTAAKMEVFRNNVADAAIEIGGHLLPILGDAAEGAGTLARGFGEMPGPLQAVGIGIGGVATAGLTLVGAIGVLAPKIHEAKRALDGLGSGGQFLSRNMGRIGAGLGIAGAAISIYSLILGENAKEQAEAEAAARGFTDAIVEQGTAFGPTTDELVASRILAGEIGQDLRDAGANMDTFLGTFRTNGDQVEDFASKFDAFAQSIGIDRGLGKALDDAGLAGTEFGDELLRLRDEADLTDGEFMALVEILGETAAAHATGARDAENQAAATDAAGTAAGAAAPQIEELGQSAEHAADEFEALNEAVQAYADSQRAAVDPLFGMLDALNGNSDAQRDHQQALEDALIAQDEYNHAVADHGPNSDEAREASDALADAMLGVRDAEQAAAESALDVHEASIDLANGIQNGTVSMSNATAMLGAWVAQGLITEAQAATMAEQFQIAAERANELEGEKVMEVRANVDQALSALSAVDQKVRSLANRGIQITATAGQFVPHAEGGWVTGPGSGDTELALLTPGEFVIRKHAAAQLGGEVLHRLNNVDRFAAGGFVGDAHAYANWHNTMVGNLGATAVGQNVIAAAGPDGDPSGDLARLLALYVELSDTIGQAAADELVWQNTSIENFELLAEGALNAAEAQAAAAERAADLRAEFVAQQQGIEDVMFAVGDLSTDDYLAVLEQRLAGTEEYSADWYRIWQQIDGINQDIVRAQEEAAREQADAAREAAEEAAAAVAEAEEVLREAYDELFEELSDVYRNATDEHTAQLDAYADAVAARSERIASDVAAFRDGITAGFRVDLTSAGIENTAQLEAWLDDQLAQADRFQTAFLQLSATGLDRGVLNDLAAQGPGATGLAEALLGVDPARVNEVLASTAGIGQGVADVALGWEQGQIEARAYADIALPTVQSMNDLLGEGLALREQEALFAKEVTEWAHQAASVEFPAMENALTGISSALVTAAESMPTVNVSVTAPQDAAALALMREQNGLLRELVAADRSDNPLAQIDRIMDRLAVSP